MHRWNYSLLLHLGGKAMCTQNLQSSFGTYIRTCHLRTTVLGMHGKPTLLYIKDTNQADLKLAVSKIPESPACMLKQCLDRTDKMIRFFGERWCIDDAHSMSTFHTTCTLWSNLLPSSASRGPTQIVVVDNSRGSCLCNRYPSLQMVALPSASDRAQSCKGTCQHCSGM